jgi:Tfp pilus assembly protein PilV
VKERKRIPGKEVNRKQNDGAAGFSLLETVISLLLMTVVGLGATSLFFFAVRNSVSASDREMAMAVAQQRMEQLRNDGFSSTNLAQTTASPSPNTIERGGRQYAVTTTIADSNVVNGSATTKTITVKVIPSNDSSVWARTVASVFGSVTLISQRSAQSVGPNRLF